MSNAAARRTYDENAALISAEFERLLPESYSINGIAEYIGVSGDLIRQRVHKHALYAIDTEVGALLPHWQFADGSPLPTSMSPCLPVT